MIKVGIHSIKNGTLYGRLRVFSGYLFYRGQSYVLSIQYVGSGCGGPVLCIFYVFLERKYTTSGKNKTILLFYN